MSSSATESSTRASSVIFKSAVSVVNSTRPLFQPAILELSSAVLSLQGHSASSLFRL